MSNNLKPRPSNQQPQLIPSSGNNNTNSNSSNPILITKSPTHQKKEKKETRVAHSAPNPFRPPPPKAPQQRPRVPSCDPPAMELPPSPLVEPPLLMGLNINKEKKPKEKESGKKKDLSRSLTNNPSFLSSSAPNVSFVNFGQKDFAPSVGTIIEKPKDKTSDEKKDKFSPKNSETKTSKSPTLSNDNMTTEKHPLPEELLATVGSPTIFSMLKSDSDVRRKSSVASNNSLPNTSNTLINSTSVINEDIKKEEEEDDVEHAVGSGNRAEIFQFEESEETESDHQSSSANQSSSSTSNRKDDFFF